MRTLKIDAIPSESQMSVQILGDCQQSCLETMTYCLKMGDRYHNMNMIGMLRDCAEMCLMCTHLLIDGSEFMGRTAQLCAEMCEKCLIFVDAFPDDTQMQACSNHCRECRDLCRVIGTQAYAYFRRSSFLTKEALLQTYVPTFA